MVSRRTFLKGAGATSVSFAFAGCTGAGWWRDGDDQSDEESDTNDDPNSSRSGDESESNTNTNNSDSDSDSDGSENSTRDSSKQDSDAPGESGDERQKEPSEEDTEIDRDQYEQTGPSDVEERPKSDVDISAGYEIADDGTVTVAGDVMNTSSEPIDFVDVEIVYLNESGGEIGSDLTVVRNLDAGETASFHLQTVTTEVDGDIAEVRGIPTPQDYVDE